MTNSSGDHYAKVKNKPLKQVKKFALRVIHILLNLLMGLYYVIIRSIFVDGLFFENV